MLHNFTQIFDDEQLINEIPYTNSQYLILQANSDRKVLYSVKVLRPKNTEVIQSTTLNEFSNKIFSSTACYQRINTKQYLMFR